MNELDSFLDRHIINKSTAATASGGNGEVQVPTHQWFSKYKKANLSIVDSDYDEFMKLYYTTILKTGLTNTRGERIFQFFDARDGRASALQIGGVASKCQLSHKRIVHFLRQIPKPSLCKTHAQESNGQYAVQNQQISHALSLKQPALFGREQRPE